MVPAHARQGLAQTGTTAQPGALQGTGKGMAVLAGQGWLEPIPAGTLSPEPLGGRAVGQQHEGSWTGLQGPASQAAVPGHCTCMSASSSCFRRRMFSSSWHSSGVRSLGTEGRHDQVSTCAPGNQTCQAPGTASAPSQQLWAGWRQHVEGWVAGGAGLASRVPSPTQRPSGTNGMKGI